MISGEVVEGRGVPLDAFDAKQTALLPSFRQRWMPVALSTEPTVRGRTERALDELYRSLETPLPPILWASSPLAAARVALLLTLGDGPQRRRLIEDATYAELLESATSVVGQTADTRNIDIRSSLTQLIKPEAFMPIRDELRDWVHFLVDLVVTRQLREDLAPALTDSTMVAADRRIDVIYRAHWGPGKASYSAYVDYLQQLELLPASPSQAPLRMLGESCGACWLFAGVAVVSERPTTISVDSEGVLDAIDAPAIQYPDGFGFFAVRGVPEAGDIFPLTGAKIMGMRHSRIRARLIREFGPERFVAESGARLAHADAYGRVFRVDCDWIEEWEKSLAVLDALRRAGDQNVWLQENKVRTLDPRIAILEANASPPESPLLLSHGFYQVPPDFDTARQAREWAATHQDVEAYYSTIMLSTPN